MGSVGGLGGKRKGLSHGVATTLTLLYSHQYQTHISKQNCSNNTGKIIVPPPKLLPKPEEGAAERPKLDGAGADICLASFGSKEEASCATYRLERHQY